MKLEYHVELFPIHHISQGIWWYLSTLQHTRQVVLGYIVPAARINTKPILLNAQEGLPFRNLKLLCYPKSLEMELAALVQILDKAI